LKWYQYRHNQWQEWMVSITDNCNI
jgi:hypothetical protein